MPSNSSNLLNSTASPLSGAEIKIIVADAINGTIINTTSVRTDSFGAFSVTTDALLFTHYDPLGSVLVPLFTLPSSREVLVIAYFEGNENTFPTYQVGQQILTSGSDPCADFIGLPC
jgi:hypothetical protein